MRKLAALLLVWTGIFLFCYALIEIFLFRQLGRLLPANIPYYFDFGANILFQYSKAGGVPEHYIAIFGDSYAEGQGDWGRAHQYERMPDTQVTHLLHHATGKDVVSFGVAGTGSIPAYLVYPKASLTFIRSLWLYDIEDPDLILLYFYEGNDITDNIDDYQTFYLANEYAPDKLDDAAYFRQFVDQAFIANNDVNQRATEHKVTNNFLFARLVAFLAVVNWKAIINGTFGERVYHGEAPTISERVSFMVGSKQVHAPDHMQMPPISQSPTNLAIGLKIFENSIRQVATTYPNSRIGVVYIPSPASVYEFLPTAIYNAMEKNPSPVPSEQLPAASYQLCEQVRAASLRQDVSFYDTRAAMRSASQQTILHGPYDWNHLSEKGYRILAQEIETFYQQMSAPEQPVVTAPCAILH